MTAYILLILIFALALLPLEIRFSKQVVWKRGIKVWIDEVRKALNEE